MIKTYVGATVFEPVTSFLKELRNRILESNRKYQKNWSIPATEG